MSGDVAQPSTFETRRLALGASLPSSRGLPLHAIKRSSLKVRSNANARAILLLAPIIRQPSYGEGPAMSRESFVLLWSLSLGLLSCSHPSAPGSQGDGSVGDGASAETRVDADAKKPVGERCHASTDCASGFCIDGTCCGSACTTPCMSCDNLEGQCITAVALGEQDLNATPACLSPSACDGAGVCKASNGQPCTNSDDCVSGHCVDAVCCESSCDAPCRTCADALGTCNIFVVKGEADTNSAPACDWPRACDGAGGCKKVVGRPCGDGTDCLTGFCVDGVCCESACDGLCEKCDGSGTCVAVADGEDPGNECPGTDTCGGVCDGNRDCRFPDDTVICTAATCSDGVVTNARRCDSAGACQPQGMLFCNGFACQGSGCRKSCGADAECATGWMCDLLLGECYGGRAVGELCVIDAQCANWQCAGGHCCSAFCDDTDATCGGSCDANGTCTYPGASTSCGSTRHCNGMGVCP